MHKLSINKFIVFILGILTLISSFNLIHAISLLEGIETTGRMIVMLILLVIDIFYINEIIKVLLKKKRKKHIFLISFMIIYLSINILISFFIKDIYGDIKSMNKDKLIHTTVVLTLDSNKIDTINNKNIGMLKDETSIEGYILPNEFITNNNLNPNVKYYDSYSNLIDALYNKEVDAIFISNNYENMFNDMDKYKDIKKETNIIASYDKKIKKEDTKDKNLLTEPFSVLLMGIDSHLEGINSQVSNGDSLILVTFNPNTLSATMLSVPRDSYVKQACFEGNIENKLTHAAWGGTQCMLKTIENFLDVDIDYYVKINFKGVVQLVDAVDGITVEVPKSVCTDNSDRKGQVCIEKGIQKLNGEQALVLSRNRYDFANGDLDRGVHQQVVVEGIINSAKNINSVNEITDILNIVSNNIDTNFTTDQILSFYNILKKILLNNQGDNLINIQKLFLNGEGQMIYDEGTATVLWNYMLFEDSVNIVSKTMKENLQLIEPELIKDFSYSIKDKYTQEIIGKNKYGKSGKYSLLPDFSNYTKDEAISWVVYNGFSYEIKEVEDTENKYQDGQIIEQSIPASKRLDKISNKHIIFNVSKTINNVVEDVIEDNNIDENILDLIN